MIVVIFHLTNVLKRGCSEGVIDQLGTLDKRHGTMGTLKGPCRDDHILTLLPSVRAISAALLGRCL